MVMLRWNTKDNEYRILGTKMMVSQNFEAPNHPQSNPFIKKSKWTKGSI